MCPAQISIEWFRIFGVDFCADYFPDLVLEIGWAGKQQVVDANRERLGLFGKPEGTPVNPYWDSA